jgi:hypothetical protein
MGKRTGKVTFGIVLLVIVVVIAVADFILAHLNQPVQGTVSTGQATSNLGFSIDPAPQTQTGPYASFEYPKGLALQKSASLAAPTLQQFNFVGRDVKSWVLSTSVASLPGGDLANNSSYMLRKNNSGTYQESTLQVNGQAVTVFSDTTAGGFSKVAFMTHGNLLGTVSLAGDDENGTAPLERAFSLTLTSWRWR